MKYKTYEFNYGNDHYSIKGNENKTISIEKNDFGVKVWCIDPINQILEKTKPVSNL